MKRFFLTAGIVAVAVVSGFLLFVGISSLIWSGGDDPKTTTDIASYESPDGVYRLVFQQVGEPEWPYGSTSVRLVLQTADGQKVNSAEAKIKNDGVSAHRESVVSVTWDELSVTVVLCGSEMEDLPVIIRYRKAD